jgi:hypothetical protein
MFGFDSKQVDGLPMVSARCNPPTRALSPLRRHHSSCHCVSISTIPRPCELVETNHQGQSSGFALNSELTVATADSARVSVPSLPRKPSWARRRTLCCVGISLADAPRGVQGEA